MQASPSSVKTHNQLMPQFKQQQSSSLSTKNATLTNSINNIVTDHPRNDSTDRQTSVKRSSKQYQIDSPNGISLRNSMKFASKRMAQGQERQIPISIQFSPSIAQLSSPSLKMRGGAATTTTTVATPTTATTEASMKGSISMLKQFTQQNAPSNTIHSKILSFLDKKTSVQHLQKIGKQQNNNRNNSGSRIATSSPHDNRLSWSNSNNNNTFQHQNNFDNHHHHHFAQHPQSASTNNLSCLNKPVVWFQEANSTSNRCILNSSCTAAMNSCQNNQTSSNFYDQGTRSSSNSNNTQALKHNYLSESHLKHAINVNIGGVKAEKTYQQQIESSLKRQVTPSQTSQYNRNEAVIYHPKASLNHGFRQKIKSRKNRKNRKTNSMTMCTTQESQDSFFENILSSGKKLVYSPQTRDITRIQETPLMNQQLKGQMNPQKQLIHQISTSPLHNLEKAALHGKMQNFTFYPVDGTSGHIKENDIGNYNSNSLNNFEIHEESKSGKKNKKNIKDESYKNLNQKLSPKQQTSERNLQRILLAQSQDSILLPSYQRNQQSQTHLSMSPPKEQSIPNSNSFIHSIEEITPQHMHPPCWSSINKQRMSSRTQQDDKDTHVSYPSQDNQNKQINSLTQSDIDQALMSFRNLLISGQENPISIHHSLTSQSNRDTYSPQRAFLHNFPRLSNALTQSQYCQYEEILSIGVQTHQISEDFGQLMSQFAERFIKPVPKLVRSTQQLVTQSMRKDEEIRKLREKVLLLKKENDKGNGNQHIKNAPLKEIIHTPSTQIDDTPQVKCKQVQEIGFSEQNQVSALQAELEKKTAIIAAMQEREKITQQFLEQLQKIGYLQPQSSQNIPEKTLNCQMTNPIEQNKEKSQQFEQQNGQHPQGLAPINPQISNRSAAIQSQENNIEIDMQTPGEQEKQQIKNLLKNSSSKSSLKPSVNSSIVEVSAQQKQQQNQEENDQEEDEEDLADLEIQFQIQQMNNQLQQRQEKNSTIKTMSSINLSDNLKQKLKLDLSSLQTNGKNNSSSIVPPLGLPQVKQHPPALDYHDEFMSRIDEFSRSWRMAVIEEQQKYLSRDNQNIKQSQK